MRPSVIAAAKHLILVVLSCACGACSTVPGGPAGAAATTRTAGDGLAGGEAASVGLLSRSEMLARTRERLLQIHSEMIADLVKAGVILRDDTATDEERREQIREVERARFFLEQVHRELESLFPAYERELAAAQARAARAMQRAQEDRKE